MMEKGLMNGYLKYKQLSLLRAALGEKSGVKLLLKIFFLTFSMTSGGNKFLLDVLVRLFMLFMKDLLVCIFLISRTRFFSQRLDMLFQNVNHVCLIMLMFNVK